MRWEKKGEGPKANPNSYHAPGLSVGRRTYLFRVRAKRFPNFTTDDSAGYPDFFRLTGALGFARVPNFFDPGLRGFFFSRLALSASMKLRAGGRALIGRRRCHFLTGYLRFNQRLHTLVVKVVVRLQLCVLGDCHIN